MLNFFCFIQNESELWNIQTIIQSYIFIELSAAAEVLSELEKQGFSGEEIITAIDATGTTDATTLTNAMICEFEYSSELPYN